MPAFVFIIFIAVGIILSAVGAILAVNMRKKRKRNTEVSLDKPLKKKILIFTVLSASGGWLAATGLLSLLFGRGDSSLDVNIFAKRTGIVILGYDVSETVLVSWGVMAVIIIAALILRIFFIPRFKDEPEGVQAALEAAVGWIEDFAASRMKKRSGFLNVLLFTLAVTLLGYGIADLAGFRSPASDPTFTLTIAFMIYIVINVYAIVYRKKKKNPLIDGASVFVKTIYKFVTGISTPVSMGCRLFGNMISGTIVMDLIYAALGSASLGIPDIVALYFGVFSSLIQMYIFITLTLTYVADNVNAGE